MSVTLVLGNVTVSCLSLSLVGPPVGGDTNRSTVTCTTQPGSGQVRAAVNVAFGSLLRASLVGFRPGGEDRRADDHFRRRLQVGGAARWMTRPTCHSPAHSYPAVPVVSSVTGCPYNQNSATFMCPTTGGTRITVSGSNFPDASNFQNAGLQVLIGSDSCTNVDVVNGNIQCDLPPGTGLNVHASCAPPRASEAHERTFRSRLLFCSRATSRPRCC